MNVMFSGKVKAAVKGDDKDKVVTAAIDAGVAPAVAEDAVAAAERIEFIIAPPIPEQPQASPAS